MPGTSVIPQRGHLPGFGDRTSGSIGHTNCGSCANSRAIRSVDPPNRNCLRSTFYYYALPCSAIMAKRESMTKTAFLFAAIAAPILAQSTIKDALVKHWKASGDLTIAVAKA